MKDISKSDILVYSSIGDLCDFYQCWSDGRNDEFKCAYNYYGESDERSNNIKNSCDFFTQIKGTKFNLFSKIVERLPRFSYYVLLDDDLNLTHGDIVKMVDLMKIRGYSVGSPSHSSMGRYSWSIMLTREGGSYRESPFVEMSAVIFDNTEMFNFLSYYKPYADKLIGWGIDHIIHSVCRKPFIIFDDVSVINPTNEQKGIDKREILVYSEGRNAHQMWLDVLKCPDNNFKEYLR
jgi:hypothetical protein